LPEKKEAKKGFQAIKTIKSIMDLTANKKIMPYKPSGALGNPKRAKHKD